MIAQVGIGWRPEIALAISRRADIGFVELVAENYIGAAKLPDALCQLKERNIEIIPHSIALSPGGAMRPDMARIKAVDRLARSCGAKLVSDHLCFVRTRAHESGHLLPVPRNRASLRVIVENIKFIKHNLSVPFALENIASVCDWDNSEYDEAEFVSEVLEQSDSLLLLDLANLFANACNHGFDSLKYLAALPLNRLAYVHIAGGKFEGGIYHDTHAHPIVDDVFQLLHELSKITTVPRIMIERDDNFPSEIELFSELDKIRAIVDPGSPEMPDLTPHLMPQGTSRVMPRVTPQVTPRVTLQVTPVERELSHVKK